MKINYSDEKLMKEKPSIFLAGPIPRDQVTKNWKEEALKILNQLQFSGIVYIPEKKTKVVMEGNKDEMNWEKEAMENADILVFWIPRSFPDMLGLTTNIEFGIWLKSGKIIYGRPDDSFRNEYLDVIFEEEYHEKPYRSLEELLKETVRRLTKGK